MNPDGNGFKLEPTFNRERYVARFQALKDADWTIRGDARWMREDVFRLKFPGVEPLNEGDARCPECGDLYDARPRQITCERCQ